MKFIIKLLKHKGLLTLFAFILLVVLVLVAGARYGLALNTRLLIILVIVFFGVFLVLLKQLKANKGATQLERSIKNQAEEHKQSLRPEKRGEIEELKNQLLAAIESLKKTRLGKGRSGRAALYALPWYMFIGPPAAGKTTAIVNSGLEFPYGNEIKGIGGTRNCDWFFSSSAIILDTAGRYITEDEDREEWLAFLEILRKHRRKKPINGVVVGMSVTDILKENHEGLEWHAKNIRRRIDELIQRLGVRFPVYLVLTKCDLVQGFIELFEGFGRKEREQIWGCTFSRSQQAEGEVRDRFDKEFDHLVQSLDEVRLRQLSAAPKPENRGKIYTFPLQVAAVKENISYFISQLFQANPYQESPCLRGFYLTSGTQEGVPIDRVIQAILKQFDLPAESVSTPEIQKKSYFIKDLFLDVIIPDQNSVFQTSKVASQKSFVRGGTVVASAVLLGALIFGVSQGFVRSRIHLKTIKGASELIRDVRWDSFSAIRASLKNLEQYRAELVRLEERGRRKPLIRSGMDRSNTVLDPARRLYIRAFGPVVKSRLFMELAGRLRESRSPGPRPLDKTYNDLKAYLLMGTEVGRLDSSNAQFLKQELLSLLDERYTDIFPQDGLAEDKPLVQRQVECFVDCLSRTKAGPFENDATLVAAVRGVLYEEPNAKTVYERMKRNVAAELQQPVSVSQIVASQDKDMIFSDFEVPELFTKQGWTAKVEAMIKKEVSNPEQTDWVLGQTASQMTSELRDPESLGDELRRLYFREYAETWWQFLRSIQYRPFERLDSAATALKRLSARLDSPVTFILDFVAQQTDFEAEIPKSVLDRAPKPIARKVRSKLGLRGGEAVKDVPAPLLVVQEFEKLRALTGTGSGGADKAGELQAVLLLFSSLNEAVEAMINDPGPKAMEFAAQLLKQPAGPLPEAVRTVRRTFDESEFDPDAREAVFEQPLRLVWAAILKEAQAQLNADWEKKVYSVFQESLARYYPFSPGGEGAALIDFGRFFSPQEGVLWKYVDEELKPFVKLESWSPVPWENQGIVLSRETIENLRKAESIKAGFFPKGNLSCQFYLIPDVETYTQVSGPRPVINNISITIDGRTFLYQFGNRKPQVFFWPGPEGPPAASLVVSTRQGELDRLNYDGQWGWFKLLERAKIEELASRDYRLLWTCGRPSVNQVQIRFRLQVEALVNPFRNMKDFFSFRCPERLD
ncbi:MAG: hypothetical protein A2Y69_03955 [Candidatus Aminicenantes bacterium RBG_13_59_9]|nr:MAG: hypothetical protein A2Y69_03955 [Candidatus Aminicenantes bacterium RBG_13_59_9]